MERKTIDFVSLGPGGADYLTRQTIRILLTADKIYCFSVKGVSHAADTICETGIDSDKIAKIDIPMSNDRNAVKAIYRQTADIIEKEWKQGLSIAVATEGDTGIYATTHYVMDFLSTRGVQLRQTPGIPSFIAAASIARLHLVKLKERLLVVPGHITAEEIEQFVENGTNIVIMKLSMSADSVHECIQKHPEYSYHYFENIGINGKDAEKHLTDINELMRMSFPYFSLMTIQKE
ncbi:MAG: precorrin-2 C(20)-methyltransferase [Bacteroides sp.]|nr:precorrin-2 C(20)-methyltransferase [Roseburia sp.]MCM1346585.1 precorrin-2 C(20)-methyltransferase [Bacteroides sp.]MCM1421401.1 precorrin-2 C(20)-methyltransferase [Bacteroides sp.]